MWQAGDERPGLCKAPAQVCSSLRVLFVVEHVPFVPATGGTTRTFHLLRAACDLGHVTLISLWGDPADQRYAETRRMCSDVRIVAPIFSPTSASSAEGNRRPSLKGAAVSLVTKLPAVQRRIRAIARFLLTRAVAEYLRNGHYDLVVVEHTDLAATLGSCMLRWDGPAIATLQDVTSVVFHRAAQFSDRRLSWSVRRQLVAIRRQERQLLARYNLVQVCSEADVTLLAGEPRRDHVQVVPNGVDVTYFSASVPPTTIPGREPAQPLLMFTGMLAHQPNVDALTWFMEQVWPLLVERVPQAHFAIVGAGPIAPRIERYAGQHGVSLHVSVPDIRPYLRTATLSVVPIRIGSGTRLKILDALAAGVPVVSTTIGAEGLALRPGREILIADDPGTYADAVCSLIECPARARELAEAGRAVVALRYDWSVMRAMFKEQASAAMHGHIQARRRETRR